MLNAVNMTFKIALPIVNRHGDSANGALESAGDTLPDEIFQLFILKHYHVVVFQRSATTTIIPSENCQREVFVDRAYFESWAAPVVNDALEAA